MPKTYNSKLTAPKYSSEQVSRNRRLVVAGAVGLAVTGMALHAVEGKKSNERPDKVQATVMFGGDLGAMYNAARKIDVDFEGDSLDSRDLVQDMQAANAGSVTVHAGQTITFQIPRTEATDLAEQSQHQGELQKEGTILISELPTDTN